jgi:two-component system sensor histidine kinase RegB
MRHEVPPGLLGNLATLRWFALAGQALTVVLVVHMLRLPLASAPLWAGIGTLAAFNLWASLRARRVRHAQPAEVLLHVAADMLVLAWLIAWSGGAMNPFAPLFLIPVALVAPALPARWVLRRRSSPAPAMRPRPGTDGRCRTWRACSAAPSTCTWPAWR